MAAPHPPTDADNLRVQIDTRRCELSPGDTEQMRGNLEAIGRQVANFPVADLHILVEHNSRSTDYLVKTTLILPGETLVASERDAQPHAAFDRCLAVLAENLRAYKERLGRVPQRQKHQEGTRQDMAPSVEPDAQALDAAVEAGDYVAFRAATFAYEDTVRRRAGRWVKRYPLVDARLGKGLEVTDIVEEVFLAAFENYAQRPQEVRFGDWLEDLIDPAIKALGHDPDQELENIYMARSAREAEKGPGAV